MLSKTEISKIQKKLNGNDKELAAIFKTLSDVNRCRMFRMFTMEKSFTVTSVAKVLNISVPLACQHLKILMFNDLVTKEKIGIKVYYELKKNNPIVHSVLRVIKQYV
jgi:DNA-binding transcriptional ArsR family regulator